MRTDFTLATLFACGLLLIGFVLRRTLPPLRKLYIPASVVAGVVGFILLQALRIQPSNDDGATLLQHSAFVLSKWPGWLISILFAGLMLENPAGRFRDAAQHAARQGIVAWIIIVGQVVIGLSLTWLLVSMTPLDVPPAFGQLIEASFAGGHGTAGALAKTFTGLGYPELGSLGFVFATYGLIFGSAMGIVLVNLGIRRGWTHAAHESGNQPRPTAATDTGNDPAESGLTPIGYARVPNHVIDPLVFQSLLVAVAFGIGYAMQQAMVLSLRPYLNDDQFRPFDNIPLFLFTLLGGLLVRVVMNTFGWGRLIDGDSIRRIGGFAIEFLIVAAMSTLRVDALAIYWLPMTVLLLAGSAWCVFCLLVVGRRLLPRKYWFEMGVINFGFSTATTAQGMMLLRIVDPDLKSGAAEDYAVAAPLTAPFIGGGFITFILASTMTWTTAPIVILGGVVLLVLLWLLGERLRRANP